MMKSENDPRPETMLRPVTFEDDVPDPTGELTEVEVVPVDEDADDRLEKAWEAEQGHRDEQDAKFKDILNAHHVAEDHAPGDRQHHGSWGPHTH